MLVFPSIVFPAQTFDNYKEKIFNRLLDDRNSLVTFYIDNGEMEVKFDSKKDFLEFLFNVELVEKNTFFSVDGMDGLSGSLSKRKDTIVLLIKHLGVIVNEVETMATLYDHFISKLKELNIPFKARRGHVDYM